MVEEKPRVQKVLEEIYQAEGTMKPKEIADKLDETPLNIGKDLHSLKERRLAVAEGEGQWKITDEGREWVESGGRKDTGKKDEGKETSETVPSQSDLFRSIGEKLGVGARKGDIRLDAITYYVQRTANLDNLVSVWNALTEMGVANDVKKRWIKIYAQNIPGKEIPEELKEKLESGLEQEKVKAETGEIPPKPKRFSVVNNEIMGDPEGDYSFKEALQYVAQQRGASPDEAGSMALELSKMGPEMLTTILTAMTPLINKEPPKPDATLSQALQTLRDLGAFGKEEGGLLQTIQALKELGLVGKADEGKISEVDNIIKLTEAGFLKKAGEAESAVSQTIIALEGEIKELKDSLQKQEMEAVKSSLVFLSNQMAEMRKEIATGGKLEGRYALMEKTISAIDNQLSGLRTDAKPLLQMVAGGLGPSKKSPEDRAKIAKGVKEAVTLEREARELEDELLSIGRQA